MISLINWQSIFNHLEEAWVYQPKLINQIKQQWHPYAYPNPQQVIIRLNMNCDGKGQETVVLENAGHPLAQNEAIAAVALIDAFPKPLPPCDVKGVSYDVLFTIKPGNEPNITVKRLLFTDEETQSPFAIKGPDYQTYLHQVETDIKSHWQPPKQSQTTVAKAQLTIHRSGHLGQMHISQSSGYTDFDQAALSAIQQAAPFAPLPVGHKGETLTMEMTFDYKKQQ